MSKVRECYTTQTGKVKGKRGEEGKKGRGKGAKKRKGEEKLLCGQAPFCA